MMVFRTPAWSCLLWSDQASRVVRKTFLPQEFVLLHLVRAKHAWVCPGQLKGQLGLTSDWAEEHITTSCSDRTCITKYMHFYGQCFVKVQIMSSDKNFEADSISVAILLYCCCSSSGRSGSQSNPLSHRDEMNVLAGTRAGEMKPIGSNVDEAELRTCCLVNLTWGGITTAFSGNCSVS